MSFFFKLLPRIFHVNNMKDSFDSFDQARRVRKPQDSVEIKKLWNLEFSKYVNP